MKILLLCDRKSSGDAAMLGIMQEILARTGHEIETITLNREELHPCVGCFGCWLKTPGQCVITNDAANSLASKEINADAAVILTEITYGGFSADIKAFLDRSVQNILPFFEMVKGEMHHKKRYERFPIWIVVGYGDAGDAEKAMFTALADRNALNLRPNGYLTLAVRNGGELMNKAEEILKTLGA